MEEAKKEREALLQEWLSKQEKEKKEKQQILEEVGPFKIVVCSNEVSFSKLSLCAVMQVPECCLCMDTLSDENRAIFNPCGHARICLDCAVDVYNTEKKQCPMCREKIRKKPTLLPKFYT